MPLAAEAPPCSVLTAEQYRFMWLHARAGSNDPPFKWMWLFGGSVLRAFTEGGHTASVSRAGLDALLAAELLERGPGVADCVITNKGRAVAP